MSCAIDARGLRFRYPNGVVGLDGVDLHVAHGERVAVLGPNGAGKTTLMLHLNGLLTGEGELDVAGIGASDVRELRAAVGLVFQDPDDQLFMPTVGEDVAFGPLNLGVPREQVHERVADALAAVRMEHVTERAAAPALARPAPARRRSRPCSRCGRGCSCSTSRPRTWTRARGASCSRCSTRSTARCSSSPTTCRSPPGCASAR